MDLFVSESNGPQRIRYRGGKCFGANPPPAFAFIQRNATLTQTISLKFGYTYQISFLSAPRPTAGLLIDGQYIVTPADLALGAVSIGLPNSTVPYAVFAANDVNGSSFTTTTGTFEALGNSATLTLANDQTDGRDTTEAFSNIVITQIGVPEPSTYAFLGLGLAALALAFRRRALRA